MNTHRDTSSNKHTFACAPMMDHTDRHFRYLLRLISRNTFLYTEMITENAVIHGDRDKLLAFSPEEHPIGVQLGGSHPVNLAKAGRIAEDYGYDEVNINVGCPSPRVKKGYFGACLMTEPDLVAECISEIKNQIDKPVTIKTRTGIDDHDSYQHLANFIDKTSQAGCQCFIIHARKAWLNGLSPRENREVPPLEYEKVYQLKKDFPGFEIIINGGFESINDVREQYQYVDGVMVGRAAYKNPYLLATIDREIFNDPHPVPSQHQIMDDYMDYIQFNLERGVHLKHMARHVLGLFRKQHGAKLFRRTITENVHNNSAGLDILRQAMMNIREEVPFSY